MSKKQKTNTKQITSSTPALNPQVEIDETIERAKYSYELVNKWIENADNKVSVSCGIFTGIFGIITFLTENFIKEPNEGFVANECLRNAYKSCTIISLLLMGIAILFYVWAIFPNLASSSDGEKKSSAFRFLKPCRNLSRRCDDKNRKIRYPLYYGDIQKLGLNDYKESFCKATKHQITDELIWETHHNAKICMKKMKRFRLGLILSFISVLFAGISFVSRFIMYR